MSGKLDDNHPNEDNNKRELQSESNDAFGAGGVATGIALEESAENMNRGDEEGLLEVFAEFSSMIILVSSITAWKSEVALSRGKKGLKSGSYISLEPAPTKSIKPCKDDIPFPFIHVRSIISDFFKHGE